MIGSMERETIFVRLIAGAGPPHAPTEAVMTAPWRRIAWIFVAFLLLPGLVLADGGGGGGGGGGDGATTKKQAPEYTAGVQAIESKDFVRAVPLLEVALQRTPADAPPWNRLAD